MDYVICHYTEYCGKRDLYILLLTIPVLPFSWITTYTFLSYFVMFGITVAFAGLFSMMGYTGNKLLNHTGCDPEDTQLGPCSVKVIDVFQVFGNIGFAMYMFEGNACVVNIRAEAKN
jgi:hypothetical protein